MSGPLLYDFGGLVTAPGLLARNPASCIGVVNWRFPQAGIMRKRLGHKWFPGPASGGGGESFVSMFSSKALNARLLAIGATGNAYVGGPSNVWSALVDALGTAPFRGRNYMAPLGPGHYVASPETSTQDGCICRVESSFTRYWRAGMPRGQTPLTYSMNAAAFTVLTGTGGFLPDGSNAAYRVTWHRKDQSNTYELGGPPTGRLVVRNINGTSGWAAATARNINLRIPVPYEVDGAASITTEYFYRLWRSQVSATDTASDELYLVTERYLDATAIANGYAAYTDLTPDAFLIGQPKLHTNSANFPALEAGLLNGQTMADNPPPTSCADVEAFAECMWFAAPVDRATLQLNLISAAFTAGNTVTIAGDVLTAVAGAPAAPGQFTIVTTLSSLSLNIEATARNLVDAYTRLPNRAVELYYVSQGSQSPGQILVIGTAADSFTCSSATAGTLFRPVLTSGVTTAPVRRGNVVKFSKPNRPDAVPEVNEIVVGLAGSTVRRIKAFRERLLCWTDMGLYQIDGTNYSNFTVSLVDSSLRVFGPGTVVVSEDRCYAWCEEGIVEVSDGTIDVISNLIEPTVQTVQSPGYAVVEAGTFAVADRAAHLVRFYWSEELNGDGLPLAEKWLEFDTRTRKWTTGVFGNGEMGAARFACGCTQNSTGLIVTAFQYPGVISPTANYVRGKTFSDVDAYTDENNIGDIEPVVSMAMLQLQVPDPDGRQHWQQLLLQFEDGEQPFYVRPTQVIVDWATDLAFAIREVDINASAIARIETPAAARRATRQRVTITHELAEHCGIIAVNQSVRAAGSRFAK